MTLLKLCLLAVLIVWAIWLWTSLEQRSLYYPDRVLTEKPDLYKLTFEDVFVKTEDGVKVHGWYIPGKKPLTILFSHGNAGNISHRMDKILRVRETGVSILIYDYRGFGQSENKPPSEKGTYRDGESFVRYLLDVKKVPASQIVYYGESLGCAVSVELALREKGAGLILESPFTSTIDMGKLVYPWLPVKWMVRYRYNTVEKIPYVQMPLLVMHSPQDETIPFKMGQQIFAAAKQPKTFFELTGGHNDGYQMTGDRYIRTIAEFIQKMVLRS